MVVQDAGDGVGAHEQRLEHAGLEAGAGEDLLDGQRALRHVGGVLEQPHVPRHEPRRGEAEYLPEGEVPRHHGQHRALRKKVHLAARGAAHLHWSRRQHGRGVVGVVAADPGALLGLGAGGGERLAHLRGHQPRPALLFAVQQVGGAAHLLGALRHRRAAVAEEGVGRALQLVVQLRRGERVECAQRLARGGVDGGDGHEGKVRKCESARVRK
jgi:hypothetical protein